MRKVLFCLIILFPFCIKAYECSNEDRDRLQKLANNVSYMIDETSDNQYKLILTNLYEGLMVIDYNENIYVGINEQRDIYIENLLPMKTYKVSIKGSDKCFYENFRDITINTLAINKYYKDEICNEAKSYSLCQKHTYVNMEYEEFVKKVKEFIDTNNKNAKDKLIEEQVTNRKFSFFEFYEKFYWPIFASMVILLVILIILWIKENKKNRL